MWINYGYFSTFHYSNVVNNHLFCFFNIYYFFHRYESIAFFCGMSAKKLSLFLNDKFWGMKSSRRKSLFRKILWAVLFFILVGSLIARKFYVRVFGSAVVTGEQEQVDLYIPSNAHFDSVVTLIKPYVVNIDDFEWVANKKNYPRHVHSGHFILKRGMSNNNLVNLLRSGKQEPVDVVFNNVRTLPELAGRISHQLEPDSLSFLRAFQNEKIIADLGFTKATMPALFIPNTYELWWNTSPKQFVLRMQKEYDRFWSGKRMRKAEAMNFSAIEVSTLAAIVDEETYRDDEMKTIAGVYINRLKKGIPLQADPTVKFAMGDITRKRIWKKHLQVDSPYNTYKYAGLPPGPIRIPSIAAVDAVLNYQNHDYYYFCANADFSGYHVFAKSLRQHNANARKYQRALNNRNIWK